MVATWGRLGALYKAPEGYEQRMKIICAMAELFDCETVESLSVSAICEKAGISRPTFYHYFADKYDAINWYHLVYAKRVLYQVGRTLTWHEASLDMFERVYEERQFFERAFSQKDSHESLQRFGEHINIKEQLKIIEENGIPLTDELEYQVRFWARSVMIAITAWVCEGFIWTPEEFAHYLDYCRPAELQRVMDEPVLARRNGASR